MTPSAALQEVAENFIPGTSDYYAKLQPDPWIQAHETLEHAFAAPDCASICTAFVSRCKELIDRYKREGIPSKVMTPGDAVNMTPEKFEAAASVKEKSCVFCGAKKDLKLDRFGERNMQVRIVCKKKCTD